MVKSTCMVNVSNGRIQFLIRKNEKGYKAFSDVLSAIKKNGFLSWYGDVSDKDGNEQSGLIITGKIFSTENIEKLSENVHKAYCKEYKKQHGKDYWTKGDYTKLTEETKNFDRKIVKVLLKAIKEA